MVNFRIITSCRSCGCNCLTPIISLGSLNVTNFIVPRSVGQGTASVPLELVLCDKKFGGCGLLQLRHTTPSELMWGSMYWYKSGINKMIREDLHDIVNKSKQLVKLNANDIVVDIGCNDGTMFGFYDVPDLNLVGFEPSKNVAAEAAHNGYHVINNFFNVFDFKKDFSNKKAKIITAISMFYDLDDPNQFIKDVIECLDEDGLFVIQQNYVSSMLSNNAFDNICHEHLEYYSFDSLSQLLDKHGLEIFDVELNGINGGSFRTYIKLKTNKSIVQSKDAMERIKSIILSEESQALGCAKPYLEFASRIENIKETIHKFIKAERQNKKVICACGASTRGNTLLQYFDLGPDSISAIADRNPDKWGTRTVGSGIPIVSPEAMKQINPDYQIVIIWHIFNGLSEEEKEFVESGGKFVLPLPEFKIVEKV